MESSRVRLVGVDALRGLFILWMIVEHSMRMLSGFPVVLMGLPFMGFMVVSGSLLPDRVNWKRWLQVLGAGILAAGPHFMFGWGGFNVLIWWALLVPVWLRVRGKVHPVWLGMFGVWLLWLWLPGGPGVVWLGLLVGWGVSVESLDATGRRLPGKRRLASFGRRPLLAYVGHLYVLLVAGDLLSSLPS